jgi:ketosteroid isomerase-like protein
MVLRNPLVRAGLTAWASGNFERLADILDPDVELLAGEPGPWDCHGRDVVIGLLRQRHADGVQPFPVQIDDVDDNTIVISRADSTSDGTDGGSATVATIHAGKVIRMRQYPSRTAALEAQR